MEPEKDNKPSKHVKTNQTVEGRSKIIRQKLSEYQKLCKIPEKMNEILLEEVIGFIGYMTEHLIGEKCQLFEDSFIGCLKVFMMRATDQPANFCKCFQELTQLLCDLCPKICVKVTLFNRILKQWLELLHLITNQQRYSAYLLSNDAFKNCAQSMARANSASEQHKLLDIVGAYFEVDPKDPSKWMRVLFEKVEFQESDHFEYGDIDYDSFAQKQMLIYNLNQRLKEPTVFTEMALAAEIGKEIIRFENDDGFIHLNEPARTIEFWIQFEGEVLKVTIRATNVDNIQIIDYDLPYAIEMVFHLHSPPKIETKDGQKLNSLKLDSKDIKVVLDSGFLKTKLQPLLQKMFNKEAEILSSIETSDLDPVLDNDSDIEIVSVVERKTVQLRNLTKLVSKSEKMFDDLRPIKVESLVSRASVKATKPSDLVKESSLVKKEPIRKVTPKRARKQESVEAVIDLSGGEMGQSPNKKQKIDYQIPTASFYSKSRTSDSKCDTSTFHADEPIDEPKTESKTRSKAQPKAEPKAQLDELPEKRPERRKAAQKAIGSIKNLADDVFEFPSGSDEPKPKKKRTPKPSKVPRKMNPVAFTSRSPFKRDEPKKPRKLFNEEDIEVVEAIEDKPRKTSIWGIDDLTGTSFRSSFNQNPQKQNQRVFDNLVKINEGAVTNRRNQNVSFSYRQSAGIVRKNKQQPADSTIMSDGSKDQLNNENLDVDVNDNIGNCSCDHTMRETIKDLQTISEISNRALSKLDPNSSACRCGALAGSESSKMDRSNVIETPID